MKLHRALTKTEPSRTPYAARRTRTSESKNKNKSNEDLRPSKIFYTCFAAEHAELGSDLFN